MKFRDRNHHLEEPTGDPASPVGAGENLDRLRADAKNFFEAADEAISAALSKDSQEFLAANRQLGGQ